MNKAALFILTVMISGIFLSGKVMETRNFKKITLDNNPPLLSIWAKGKGDFNGDRHVDFMTGGEGSVIWYENPGGKDTKTRTRHIAYSGLPEIGFEGTACGCIENDGRNDIVLTPTEKYPQMYETAWYEAPVNPAQENWKEHLIDNKVQCITHSLGVYDFDNDGMLDVFTAEMEQSDDPDEVRIYYNSGKGTSWTKIIISDKGSHWNQFADIDADGDIDIFGANHGSKGPPVVELCINQTNQKP